ncbi:MAG TPA: hypothetical protein VG032_02405, partial [Acidimicrobiales bacterium]|nr:hypothetical protein [Acidimicrobiales bacterium]
KGAASGRSDSLPVRDLSRSVYSVESASRVALALDTKASLLQAVEKPAMDTAIAGGAGGQASVVPSARSSGASDGCGCDVSLLLMTTHSNGQ